MVSSDDETYRYLMKSEDILGTGQKVPPGGGRRKLGGATKIFKG